MENLREVPPINELDELECSSDPEENSVTIADSSILLLVGLRG